MHCYREIDKNLFYIGGSERRIQLFENLFPVPDGVAYNSYLLIDKKTVLLDTVDQAVAAVYLENLEHLLGNKKLDYLIINHMELDHSETVLEVIKRYPEVTLVMNSKSLKILNNYYHQDFTKQTLIVNEGDQLEVGEHIFSFYFAPMVHWPEVMVTYEQTKGVLFSADAFGTFGALNGNIFNDELLIDEYFISEMRRYYSNIVGKYGAQVQKLLEKVSHLSIQMICPLHGPIWRSQIDMIVHKYSLWSAYQAEEKAVSIFYGSMYGNTENCCFVLANQLACLGVQKIKMFDVSKVDISYMISDMFRVSNIVIACPTYNGGLYPKISNLLEDMVALNILNKKVAIIENGTWASMTSKQIKEKLNQLKKIEFLEEDLTIISSLKENQLEQLNKMALRISQSMKE